MKIGRKSRKRLIITLSVMALLAVIVLVAGRILGRVLEKNRISWTSLSYHFPDGLTIEGLRAEPGEGFRIELERLEVEWSLGSLLRGRPAVTRMFAGPGHVWLRPEPDTASGGDFSLPKLSLGNVRMEELSLDLYSEGDTILYRMAGLYLSSAATGELIQVDTLLLREASLRVMTHEKEDPGTPGKEAEADNAEPFPLEGIPGFDITRLELEQCDLLLEQQENRQHIGELDLVLNGWKSSDLLNVVIGHFSFVYQDTLDVELVLENGEINREFKADLNDLELRIPGISLAIAHAAADLQEEIRGSLSLAPSYLTLGRIRQLYPGIDSIIHPDLPASTRIHLQGGLEMGAKTVSIRSLLVSVLDSTSLEINGSVSLAGKPELDVRILPLRSTRGDLLRLLTPQNYHRFYLWPHDINGEARAQGTLDNLGIYGNLPSREGVILVESHVKSDPTGGFFFSLDIWSDSVYVNGITALLPLTVPHGQVRFYLEMKGDGTEEEMPLWINITSDHLYTFDRYIRDIEFGYYGDAQIDSMHVGLNDTVVKLTADLVTPMEGDGTTFFEAAVDHIFPGAFEPSLPDGSLSTHLKGTYLFGENSSEVGLELTALRLAGEEYSTAIPDSRIEMKGEGDRISLRGETAEGPFLVAETGTAFPEFGFPLPAWLGRWPDTELQLSMRFSEGVVGFLTGTPGHLDLQSFELFKDSTRWDARLSIPALAYREEKIYGMEMELNSDLESLNGHLDILRLEGETYHVEGISAGLAYRENLYWFDLTNGPTEFIGTNRIALVADVRDSSVLIRFNDTVPLTLNEASWQVDVNRGVLLDRQFRLKEGDLGIRSGVSRLEAVTSGEVVTLEIDSLELEPLLSYLTAGELVEAWISGTAEFNTSTMDAEMDATILAFNEAIPDPASLHIGGSRRGESLRAGLDFRHADAAARASIRKEGGPLEYALLLDHFDLAAMRYIPGLPPDLEVSGRLAGRASGSIGEEISTDGYLIAEDLTVIPPVTGSPLRLEHDTLFLRNREVILNDFRISDSRGQTLSLQGTIQYSPEVYGSLRLTSERFALLDSRDRDAQIQGTLMARADLAVEGGMEKLMVTGNLETLPGAEIRYISEESFNMVDASQIVTFMDLEEADSTGVSTAPASTMDIQWNVDLQVDETTFEILLDEITQEYIRIVSQGSLNLRSGPGRTPMVFGSVSSTEGRAFISPPAIPDLDLVVEEATIRWDGILDDPVINFRGHKLVKGLTGGLSTALEETGQLVDYRVYVILDNATLSEFDLKFDLEVEDSEAQILLASLPEDTRQAYALNLLVFGRIGTEKIKGNAILANQVTHKLNELSRRNLKHAGLNFSSTNYRDRSDGISERERTELNYSLSRGFLHNKLKVSVGGSVGFYMDDLTVLPPTNLIGDLELSYRLSDHPTLILKGTRKNVYEGIIDGMVTEESLGLTFQKSYPTFPLFQGGSGTSEQTRPSE